MKGFRRAWDWAQDPAPLVIGCGTAIIFAIGAVCAVGLAAALVDGWYDARAARKQIACAVQRMDYRRVPFTTEVTCVPKALDTRNDTLTIQR